MTFEHRHENKSCSACRDRVNERVKVVKVVKVAKVVKVKVFQNIPGSQLLSDIQTFLAGNQLYELKCQWIGKFSGSQCLSDFQTFLAGNQLYEL